MEKTSSKKRVTVGDVAAAVGVTKSTVSLALANKGNFTAARREEIWRVARSMNYVPNPHARRLATGRFENMIALFTLELDLNVGTKKLQHLQHQLSELGYDVPIYAHGNRAQEKGQLQLMQALCLQSPRMIVCSTHGLSPATLSLLREYQEDGGIVVSYDHPFDLACDQVVFDRQDNTYRVVRHLLELGHREIAFTDPPSSIGTERHLGYQRALEEYGIEPHPDWVFGEEVSLNAEPFSKVYEESGALLARRFLELTPRPTAVCILDDYQAVGFAAELGRAGVRVPEEVSIVGHDDSPIARFGPLQLTTATHPVKAIASAVVELVKDRLENPDSEPREKRVFGELVIRNSAIPR